MKWLWYNITCRITIKNGPLNIRTLMVRFINTFFVYILGWFTYVHSWLHQLVYAKAM